MKEITKQQLVALEALTHCKEKEIKGGKHNPKIVNMFKVVGHSWVNDDETAWCAAFVGYILERNGIPCTRKLNARSYLNFGTKTNDPKVGDIVVLWRNGRNSAYGHVGFYAGETKNNIKVLGGNQNNEINVSLYPKYRLLEYRTY